MEAIYATVTFKKHETGDAEPSKTVAEKEDVTYSTLKFSTQGIAETEESIYSNVSVPKQADTSHSDLSRPDETADPTPEPGSKITTTGQTKGRILLILLCVLFFAAALVIGLLYITGNSSHKENITEKDELIKQLQIANTNLSSDFKERERIVQQLQDEKKNLSSDLQEREKIIQQLQTEMDEQTCYLQSSNASDACCAESWKYFSGKCYYFSTDKKTWTESRDACVAAGGDLVIINSTEEQDFLKRSYPGGGGQDYWVGLTDAVKEGDWRWLDGTRLSRTSIYWSGTEPDNWTGKNKQYPEGEDCAVMHLNTYYYRLQDAFCAVEERKEKRVCETKVLKRIKQRKGQ